MQRIVPLLFLTTILLIALPVTHIDGQDANALRDGGMEGSYTSRGAADLNVPAEWSFWFATSPRSESWQNLQPVGFPHNGPGPNPHSGARAVNLNKGFATFTAALFQQVTVTQGANVTASAWAYLKTCDIPDGFDNCPSDGSSGAYTRVGIDPNGGTNPYDSDIVWSGNATPHDNWGQMTVSATTTGTTVTVFLFATQAWPKELNNVYWDDASLVGGGAGGAAAPAAQTGATPIPTVPLEVGFVSPQNEQDDGSLIHRVQPGDTIDSIAVAYGLTRADVLALNPTIRDPRIIQIGQEIIIRAPSSAATAEATAESATESATASAAATADPQSADELSAPETTGEATAIPTETAEPTQESTPVPPAPVDSAPPAPIRSVAGGDVLPPIDPAGSDAQVCISLYDDVNANRVQEIGEESLAGGMITLSSTAGTQDDHEMDGSPEPYCFTGLAAGEYTAFMQAPAGYGLTTPDQLVVRAQSGAKVNLAFGAAQGIQPVTPPPADNLTEITADEGEPATTATADPVQDNLGLIVFGAAGAVLVIGMGISLVMRRR
ncbi:MAG: LysM peptidoglycan-binding domain-containing protein [Anaerolinea sp.]|nr:LysM peptidoglycan-binding domain-containing protein [Anaerolinea sp.]